MANTEKRIALGGEVQNRRCRRAVFIVVAFCTIVALVLAACEAWEARGNAVDVGGVADASVDDGAGGGGGEIGGGVGAGGKAAGVVRTTDATDGAGSTYTQLVWDELRQGSTLEDALVSVGFQKLDSSNAPAWFEQEISPLTYFDSVFASIDETLFALQVEGSQASELQAIRERMEAKGWQCRETGAEGVLTFYKSEGECRWAMLECSEMDGACNMVLRIQRV